MKAQILASVLALSAALPASASYYQNYCASADARVQMKDGHSQNSFTVLIEKSTRGTYKAVELQNLYEKYTLDESDIKVVKKEGETKCPPRPADLPADAFHSGYSWSRTLEVKTITMKRTDGKAFPKGFPGLAADSKSAKFEVLCESNYSNMAPCGNVAQ